MKENLGTYLFLVYLSIATLGKGIVSFGKGLKGGSPTCLYQVRLLEMNLSPQHSSPLWARVLWKPASTLKLCGENHQINPLVCKVDAGQGNSDGLQFI